MQKQLRRVRAFLAGFLVLTSVGCVKIPQHNFQAPAPPVAPAPAVQSSAAVKADRISSAPIGPALISAVPRNIDADRLPGGCATPVIILRCKHSMQRCQVDAL